VKIEQPFIAIIAKPAKHHWLYKPILYAAFTRNGFDDRNETWRLWKRISKF